MKTFLQTALGVTVGVLAGLTLFIITMVAVEEIFLLISN
jgi:hypothetical protein